MVTVYVALLSDPMNNFLVRHLPSWIPGTSFHKFAKAFHNAHEDVLEEPLKDVESRMVLILIPMS